LHQTNLAQIAALRQSNAELDAFAHTVAHDLKNPLTNLQLYADIVQRQLSADDDPTLVRGMRHIVENAARMGRIMEALLLLSGVRRQQVALAPLNMAQIVEQAQQRLQIQAQAAKADIYLPSAWPTAVGYAPWVEEIWYNYLSNGLKYGGRPCRLELGATAVDTPHLGASYIRFWVRDNGPGVYPEIQHTLFEEFTQLTPEQRDGYGLGLSIVRRIATKLGGHVGFETAVGKGSLFYFTLPATT
ncbi:MAG: HAMP domain-containing histidine kinase, partial [Anaerolineales bacterium]|nr:HAMP domain-containing histidine kinase [Anaerolineales bacterium]